MKQDAPGWVKPLVDYGPLAVFFVVYLREGLITATAALIVATAAALVLALIVARRLPWLPLITAAVVGVFGGLTVWLEDETFIKLKPTIVQVIFALLLLGGLAVRRPLLKPLMGAAWRMDERGWHRLSMRFGLFFAAMALLNELVWRTQSTETWVYFKIFGILGLTFVFALAQMPLMLRHKLEDEPDTQAGE